MGTMVFIPPPYIPCSRPNRPYLLSNRLIQSVNAHPVPPSPVAPENPGMLPLLMCTGANSKLRGATIVQFSALSC